jgi:glycosyltransferase involved in cell wall biosynthesis
MPDSPAVSVVIPTYNGREKVLRTVRSLYDQDYPANRLQVVVVDDGSVDGTGDALAALSPPFEMAYLWQQNRGRCSAKNAGMQKAQGEIILLLDGDMLADPKLVSAHVESHQLWPDARIRGRIQLLPTLRESTLFGQYYLPGFEQREAREAAENGMLSFSWGLTGNLSLRAQHLAALGPFDEAFDRSYGWADVDWGYRASRLGLKLVYNAEALSYHDDYAAVDLAAFCRRTRISSRSAVTNLFSKHPELEGLIEQFSDMRPINWRNDSPRLVVRKLARVPASLSTSLRLLRGLARACEGHYPKPDMLRPLYRWIVGGYIYQGYQEGLRARRTEANAASRASTAAP